MEEIALWKKLIVIYIFLLLLVFVGFDILCSYNFENIKEENFSCSISLNYGPNILAFVLGIFFILGFIPIYKKYKDSLFFRSSFKWGIIFVMIDLIFMLPGIVYWVFGAQGYSMEWLFWSIGNLPILGLSNIIGLSEMLLISLIFYFLLGMFVRWIIWKIKNRNN